MSATWMHQHPMHCDDRQRTGLDLHHVAEPLIDRNAASQLSQHAFIRTSGSARGFACMVGSCDSAGGPRCMLSKSCVMVPVPRAEKMVLPVVEPIVPQRQLRCQSDISRVIAVLQPCTMPPERWMATTTKSTYELADVNLWLHIHSRPHCMI
jgi:hypothetical protein